ncbi:MAG: dual specificity protein phosphatase family protein [Halobaculum sp.]
MVYVRPKGYVEPRAVVERIGDRDLFVGNFRAATAGRDSAAAEPHRDSAAEPHRPDRTFDAVLSVGSESYHATTHHHPLVDGPETDWREFAAAVETARDLHRADGSLLIHCKAGISRSVAVLATTLAVEEGRSFHDALSLVQEARPHAIPHPALHLLGVIYVAARVAGGENSESEERPE